MYINPKQKWSTQKMNFWGKVGTEFSVDEFQNQTDKKYEIKKSKLILNFVLFWIKLKLSGFSLLEISIKYSFSLIIYS